MMKPKKQDDSLPLYPALIEHKQTNKLKLACLLLCIGIVFSVGAYFILNYSQNKNIPDHHENRSKIINCPEVPDLDKFDCFPNYPLSEQACLDRGCCYHNVTAAKIDNFVNSLGVPHCYYPNSYKGYTIIEETHNDRHIIVRLKREVPSGFPKDVIYLLLMITMIDDNTVRIKITDAGSSRFEVPIKINDDLKEIDILSYKVILDSKSNLNITRTKTNRTIFSTNLSRLVFSDQFIQLSSYLPSPYIYGIGESYGPMLRNMNWTRITLFNSDNEPAPHYPLYGSQPFYLSMESDGNANGVFLLNSNAIDVILQPTPAITFRPIGGILDFFVFLGSSPAAVVQQYTNIVGQAAIPPYWSLGFHLCRYGYHTLNKTKETLQRNIDAGILIDVQWNDIDYMDKYKDFTYDKVQFAGLPEFVDDLHAKGMHYVIMTDPGLSNSEEPGTYPPYDEGAKRDIFMKNPNGTSFVGKVWTDGTTVFPDFSNPSTMSYWIEQFEDFYKKVKYDGIWLDMNEPSNFVDGGVDGCIESSYEDPPYLPGSGTFKLRHKTACMTAKHYNTIHYNEHNILGYRESHATNMALRLVRRKRPFIISRATFAGQGVYSGHWSGDIASTWEDMRYTIPFMINFNMYGIPMVGSDICGFNKNTTVELCARWQELGAFYPFSRNHNERITIEQDPAALGPTVIAATAHALDQRYFLLPYIYTLFYRSHVFGDTVVRPMFFEFPTDKNTFSQDEQFMLGPAIMIIPALYPINTFPNKTLTTVYLPEGDWYDGAKPHLIDSMVDLYGFEIDLLSITTLGRGGYIVPCQIPASTTTKSRENDFFLMVSLNRTLKAEGELFWDDGDSLDTYENGAFNLIQFSVAENVLHSKVLNSNYGGKMNLSYIQLNSPTPAFSIYEVTFNGVKCLRKTNESSFDENELPPRKSFWSSKYLNSSNIPDGEMCVFERLSDCSIYISLISSSLLIPFNVTWSFD